MRVLVLDSEAVSNLARSSGGASPGPAQVLLERAVRDGADVVVPAAVLAEQYRGQRHDQLVDSFLGRQGAIRVIDTTREFARRVGHVLARAGRGSADHVDATVVAAAGVMGGAVIATSDPDDMRVLAAGIPGITVVPV
ncbi:MAG: type II toxin-antitoxin system VapC family toxin [Bifidobacteriaceae bacterium]|jgi:hypothetical protein|nr:type II toxin-antitoxin system VapC family toxin [Bifidobacteriaceae bacterium]